jgi:hypothetical protein
MTFLIAARSNRRAALLTAAVFAVFTGQVDAASVPTPRRRSSSSGAAIGGEADFVCIIQAQAKAGGDGGYHRFR